MKPVAVSCLALLIAVGGFSIARPATAEIVVPAQPDSMKTTSKSAAEARSKAKLYQDSGSASPTIIVIPEEEEGLLGPRRQPESRASENRAKARQYQEGGAPQIPAPLRRDPAGSEMTTSERASENKARARAYVSTDNTIVIQRIGADGIPIVSCGKLADNVAGRIGDDAQSGGIFFIMRDNKPFKVRCAPP